MKTKLGVVLAPGLTFTHEYDFGECSGCGAAATQLGTEAIWEGGNPFYCELHAKGDEWAFLPVVNSPRMGGVCAGTPLENA